MIILCVVAALVFLAVKLFRLCVAAIVAVRVIRDRRIATRRRSSLSVAGVAGVAGRGSLGRDSTPRRVPDEGQAPSAGPQDAPLDGPWPPVDRPQDTGGYPQDAPIGSLDEARAEPLPSTDVAPATVRRVVAQLAAAVVARREGPTLAVTELADGRLVLSLTVGREARAEAAGAVEEQQEPAGGGTVLDLVPRPTSGPAYLGGRDDDAYLRGWDDGVDWVREGNPERAPSWSSAAYMTGWNDSLRAVAKLRCA